MSTESVDEPHLISPVNSMSEISSSENESVKDESLPRAYTKASFPTYKIVGDDIDKSVKPRDMRINNQTKSIHYFHSYMLSETELILPNWKMSQLL